MRLRVHFDAPGFFLNDPRLRVTIGESILYDGSFKRGFDVSLVVPSKELWLETSIGAGGIARRQRIPLPLDASGGFRDVPEVHAELTYSRVRGNFDKRAHLSAKR